jgi:hypothetical protein
LNLDHHDGSTVSSVGFTDWKLMRQCENPRPVFARRDRSGLKKAAPSPLFKLAFQRAAHVPSFRCPISHLRMKGVSLSTTDHRPILAAGGCMPPGTIDRMSNQKRNGLGAEPICRTICIEAANP